MSDLIKDATFNGFVDETPSITDYHTIQRMTTSIGAIITRFQGKRLNTGVITKLFNSYKYVTPTSGTDGGWKTVFVTTQAA